MQIFQPGVRFKAGEVTRKIKGDCLFRCRGNGAVVHSSSPDNCRLSSTLGVVDLFREQPSNTTAQPSPRKIKAGYPDIFVLFQRKHDGLLRPASREEAIGSVFSSDISTRTKEAQRSHIPSSLQRRWATITGSRQQRAAPTIFAQRATSSSMPCRRTVCTPVGGRR